MIDCCDRMIRPYSCIAPVVSARLLLSQGKGATLPPSAMCPQSKNVGSLVLRRDHGHEVCKPAPRLRAVTHAAWQQAKQEGDDAVSVLLAQNVAVQPVPYHSWPLPLHVRLLQEAAVQPPAPRASIYGCFRCRSGLFVGHSVGGKKCEALGRHSWFLGLFFPFVFLIPVFVVAAGDVLTEQWHCPVCPDAPVLQCISLIGQVVQCNTGCFTACTKCPFPSRFFDTGLVCAACTKICEALATSVDCQGERCWFDGCKRPCTSHFQAVPFGGIEEGEEWETLSACTCHTFPSHLTVAPIPRDQLRRVWWSWKRGTRQ